MVVNEPLWWLTKDGDKDCLAMYERHYSAYRYADGRKRTQFVGPGEKVVLRTEKADAVWAWRKFHDDSGQQGVNCAVFRNESGYRSSLLISQADQIADVLWAWLPALHLRQPGKGRLKEPWILLHRGRLETLRPHEGRIANHGTLSIAKQTGVPMTLCAISGVSCMCQPDEGVVCPYHPIVVRVAALEARIRELETALREIADFSEQRESKP